ncbi:MAG: DMT family transporter [Bryobacterales bacterium]|nr:DMT family transporter [Bryobacterales bacterium]
MSARTRGELALIAVTLVWGASFVLVKNTLEHISTWLFLALRFTVAAVCLGLFFGKRAAAGEGARGVALTGGLWAGLCLAAGFCFQTFGLRYTTPSKSAFITGLTSALVPFLAFLVYRKAPHPSEAMGVAAATVGLGLLTMPAGALGIGYGDAISLCCTVAYAGHILLIGRYSPKAPFELLSLTQLAVTAAVCWAMAGFAEAPYGGMQPRVVGAVLFTGILCTAIPFTVQTWAQQHTTATRTALIFAFEPVSAVITSYAVLGETLSGRGALGALLILAGVLTVELKPGSTVKHPS